MKSRSLAIGGVFLAGVAIGGVMVWYLARGRTAAPAPSSPEAPIDPSHDRAITTEKPVRTEPEPARELGTEQALAVASPAAPRDAAAQERPKEPVLRAGEDGPALTESWAKELGLTDAQLQAINTSLKAKWTQWRQIEDAHIRFEGRKTDDHGTERLSYKIEAFADDGAQLKELLATDLAHVLTEDQKAGAMPVLDDAVAKEFRGFGAHERRLELAHYSDDTYGCIESRPDLADLRAKGPARPGLAVATKGKKLPPAYQHLWH